MLRDVGERSLRAAWEAESEAWTAWARTPGHDHQFWRFLLPAFLDLVPPPGRLTLDAGCGEGRVGRALTERGHRVVGVDGSPMLARLAGAGTALADLVALPVRDGAADLVVAHMVLQDVDDITATVAELARVLAPDGTLCVAVMHPVWAPLDQGLPYATEHRTADEVERDGLAMTFHSVHRPLAAYGAAFEASGLAITALREPVPTEDHVRDHPSMAPWVETPPFLHLRAVRAIRTEAGRSSP